MRPGGPTIPPRRGLHDPQWDRLLKELAQTFDWQQRVIILGETGDKGAGGDVEIRYLASRATLFVQEHIQTDNPGEGGSSYDPVNFLSSTRVDCRANRQQDLTVSKSAGIHYWIWFVPVFLEQDGTYTKFDGADAEDHMAFWDLGV